MAVTSLAVVAFLWRGPDRRLWPHVIAPALLTGSTSGMVNRLPFLLLAVAILGFVTSSRRPLQARPHVQSVRQARRQPDHFGRQHATDGSRTVNRAPPPGALSAVTRPPWASATCRTMASPRPVPGRPRAVLPR